eukprot:13847372-Heterocapsa_arctica.AAC.1
MPWGQALPHRPRSPRISPGPDACYPGACRAPQAPHGIDRLLAPPLRAPPHGPGHPLSPATSGQH